MSFNLPDEIIVPKKKKCEQLLWTSWIQEITRIALYLRIFNACECRNRSHILSHLSLAHAPSPNQFNDYVELCITMCFGHATDLHFSNPTTIKKLPVGLDFNK